MKKSYLFLLLFINTFCIVNGQVTFRQGDRESILSILGQKIDKKNIIKTIELKAPELPNDTLPTPSQLIESINIKINNSHKLSNWTVKLTSIGSPAINLVLSDLHIADGSSLYIYNEDLTSVMGPIDKNNSKSFLTTPEIHGDIIYIQVNEGDNELSSFNIFKIAHGFMTPSSNTEILAMRSTECIPSVTCYSAWDNESNSVGLVRVFTAPFVHVKSGSGTLVNNEAQDGRPFFLTALHVLDVDKNGSLSSAEKAALAYLEVSFDFRWTTCAGSTIMTFITMTGAAFKAAWADTDFALIELDQNPSLNSTIRYAGWNRTGSTPTSGIAIHHPNSEHMRYSNTYNAAIRVYPLNWNYFEVLDWSNGFVGPGSSGSALFNGDHQVVGVLSKGKPDADCDTFFESYKYGRFYDSWNGGGTSDTQLKHWLSPTQNLSSMNTFNRLRFTANQNNPVCYGSNRTYTLDNIMISESATWSVTSGISIVSSTYNSITVTATNPGTNGAASITATFGTESVTKYVWYGTPSSVYGTMDGTPVSYPQPCSTSSRLAVIGQGIQNCSWTVTAGSIPITPVSGQPHMCDIGYFYDYARITAQPSNTCGSGSDYTFYLIDPSMWFMAYPNPATNELTIQFSDISNSEILPKAVYLYHESSTIPKKQANIKEIYDKNGLAEGNKLIWDVSGLPRGVYYLHVVPSEKSGKKEIEKLRIILE